MLETEVATLSSKVLSERGLDWQVQELEEDMTYRKRAAFRQTGEPSPRLATPRPSFLFPHGC